LKYNPNYWTASPRKQKETRSKEEQPKTKRRKAKGCSHTTQENSVETKRSSKVHHHTTKIKQNGVETKEGAIIHAYSSGHGCPIVKQKVKGEESCSLDFKR